MKMDYVEPAGYFTPSALKILKEGEKAAKKAEKQTAKKSAPKKSTKK